MGVDKNRRAVQDEGGKFSTGEVFTGRTWIDGRRIFRKTIYFGALPNATSKSVAHGIGADTVSSLIFVFGAAYKSTEPRQALPLPNDGLPLGVTETDVNVTTSGDFSAFDETYLTLEYTKL